MPLSDYHESIKKARQIPLSINKSTQVLLDKALRGAWAELDNLLRESAGRDDKIIRRLWEAKQNNLAILINELALTVNKLRVEATGQVIEKTVTLREDATNALMRERQLATLVDFSSVHRLALERLAQRIDVEGLKLSSNIWAEHQLDHINQAVATTIARGQSVIEGSKRLRPFVLGADSLTEAELADLRRIRGADRRKLGQSINAKAKRVIRTEAAQASLEATRLSAERSPIVGGVKWNLSARHPHWDVCDILASQDLYGMGRGVYPPSVIPPRPHPNDLCVFTDVIRPAEEWSAPKPEPQLVKDIDGIEISGKGTEGYIRRQTELFREITKTSFNRPTV